MLRHIVFKEIAHGLRSLRVIVILTISTLLVLLSLFNGAFQYATARQEMTDLVAAEADRLSAVIDFREDFIDAGVRYYRIPSPLMALVRGVEGDAARKATVGYLFFSEYEHSALNADPVLAVFGMLDFAFIVKIIISLFALLFTFDCISGERESGTLRQCLAMGVPRRTVLMGKVLGNWLLLFVPFLVVVLTGLLLTTLFFPVLDYGLDAWLRISTMLVAAGIYCFTFIAMGTMVSAIMQRSFISLLTLLLVWIGLVAIVPRMSIAAADLMYDLPAEAEMRRSYYQVFNELDHHLSEGISDLWDSHHEELNRHRPVQPDNPSAAEAAQYNNEVLAFRNWISEDRDRVNSETISLFRQVGRELKERERALLGNFDSARQVHSNTAGSIASWLSPGGALTSVLTRMARTDVHNTVEVFKAAIDNEARLMTRFVDEVLAEYPNLGGFREASYEPLDLSKEYRSDLQLDYRPYSEDAAAVLGQLAYLLLLGALLFGGGVVALNRYDVR